MFQKLPTEIKTYIREFLILDFSHLEEEEKEGCDFECFAKGPCCTEKCEEYYIWLLEQFHRLEENEIFCDFD